MTDRNAAAAMDKSGKPGDRKVDEGKGKDREREGNNELAHKSPNKKRRKVNHGTRDRLSNGCPEVMLCGEKKLRRLRNC